MADPLPWGQLQKLADEGETIGDCLESLEHYHLFLAMLSVAIAQATVTNHLLGLYF